MKLHRKITQKSPEWHNLRALNFTASELGPWITDPVRVNLTVEKAKAVLDRLGISYPKSGFKDQLLALLPDKEPYMQLCDGAKTAIIGKIKAARLLYLRSIDWDDLTPDEKIYVEREDEMEANREKAFSYNIPVKYGNLLEPSARSIYESITGFEVEEIGFIEHAENSGFGCSPDGLVRDVLGWSHGIEIKCPIPETHLAWLDDRDDEGRVRLPEIHRLQVHASLAVTGLTRWDFLSYCPGEETILIEVHREDFTEQVLAGLKTLVAEKAKMLERRRATRNLISTK